jgi:hypothetical protein
MEQAAGVALALFALALFVYASNLHTIGSGDSESTKLVPVSLLRHGSLYLDDFAPLYQGYIWPIDVPSEGRFHGVVLRRGHWVSAYPVVLPVLAVPLYLPAVAWLDRQRVPNEHPLALSLFDLMEKLTAATVAAASVALVYLLLRRLCRPRRAAAVSLIYGFASNTWVAASQAMWQHCMSELLIALALLALVRSTRAEGRPSGLALGGAGLATALAVANRPPNAILAACLAVYVVHRWRRESWPFFIGPILMAVPFLAYNRYFFGSTAGLFGGHAAEWSTPLHTGLAGLLLSPSRGLFVYVPWTLLSGWGAVLAWRSRQWLLLRYLSIAVAGELLLYASWVNWWGGAGFGPRLLTDLLPLLTLLLVPLVEGDRRRLAGSLLAGSAMVSVLVQIVGAFFRFPGLDDPRLLWSLRDSQLAVAMTAHEPAPFTQTRNWTALRDLMDLDAGGRRTAFHSADGGVVHRAVLLPSQTGALTRHPTVGRGWVRHSDAGSAGVIAFDPYLPLAPGGYVATLVMRATPAPTGLPVALLEARVGSSGPVLARLAVLSTGGLDSGFARVRLPFEVPPFEQPAGSPRRRIELRIIATGAGNLDLEQVELLPSSETAGR